MPDDAPFQKGNLFGATVFSGGVEAFGTPRGVGACGALKDKAIVA
jgi:hypothetical protein